VLRKIFGTPVGGVGVRVPVHIFYAKLMFLVF
jgi:hypothetical protein